jgi:hypothetical protein
MDRNPIGSRVQPRAVAKPDVAGAQLDAPEPSRHVPHHAPSRSNESGSKKVWVLSGVALVIVLLVLAAMGWMFMGNNEYSQVKTDKYQTVFLTNGQVYFGKVKAINKDYVQLTDIYYLQVQQAVQPTDGKSSAATDDASSKTQLVKLGNELHGPDDSMQINRSQVLFWENIKDDGKVAQAIKSDTTKK